MSDSIDSDKVSDNKFFIMKYISKVKTDWKPVLVKLIKPYIPTIDEFLTKEREIYGDAIKTFPPPELIFNCFNQFPFKKLKVVILGQDPYINEGQAMGLSFSIPKFTKNSKTKFPPSLRNIYKELYGNLKKSKPSSYSGDLTNWAKQGVLLLNSALTVRQYKSNSHKQIWQKFTDDVIQYISDHTKNVVFILWGNFAIKKGKNIDTTKHHIISSVHPSPLSATRGFFGSEPFIKCNKQLVKYGKKVIEWDTI